MLIASCIGISLVFAVIHPYLWEFDYPEDAAFWEIWRAIKLDLTAKPLWSTGILFVNSLWFYYVRFSRLNTHRSLIPCFLAHGASNLGVFVIKYLQDPNLYEGLF